MNHTKSSKSGFSIIELLSFIAAISVVAAIAIPNMGNAASSANVASAKRNAQSIASAFAMARAAGAVADGAYTDVASAAAAVQSGITVSDAKSSFNGRTFDVAGLDVATLTAAKVHLTFARNELIYTPASDQ